MRHAGRVCAGIGFVLAVCGFAPPVMAPPLSLFSPAFSLPSPTPAPECPVTEPLVASLTPDTRHSLEAILTSA